MVTPADWRALIQAYLEGRLSADAFRRRFLEAFDVAVRARAPTPPQIQALFYVVEAYAGDPMGRGHDVADDADLLRAAKAALGDLPTGPDHAAPPPPARERVIVFETQGPEADGDARRMVRTLAWRTAPGCIGVLAYVALALAQFFAAAAQVESVLGWGPAPSAILGLVVALTPVAGGVVAFFGAKDVWGWAWPLAAGVFLLVPLALTFGGLRLSRRR